MIYQWLQEQRLSRVSNFQRGYCIPAQNVSFHVFFSHFCLRDFLRDFLFFVASCDARLYSSVQNDVIENTRTVAYIRTKVHRSSSAALSCQMSTSRTDQSICIDCCWLERVWHKCCGSVCISMALNKCCVIDGGSVGRSTANRVQK